MQGFLLKSATSGFALKSYARRVPVGTIRSKIHTASSAQGFAWKRQQNASDWNSPQKGSD
eukprot:4350907-Pyramimonas_sp.AAC.1